ncbi:MAG: S1 RNA-binding domain-containing protein [Ruminococcaceae bacterium]|nr:S1 RNA-binding domain-containing protein [Oscillospiraceae bacterium]
MNVYKPEGMILGSARNRELLALGKSGLERAMLQGIIMESTVLLCDGNMDLHVDLRGVTGIIPREEVCLCRDGESVKDIAIITRVGKPVCFKVTSIEERGGRTLAYLSRRAAQLECQRNFILDLIPGDVIPSKVTHLENFGAFVDIGCGIVSLLSVDCISVSRFSHPKDRLYNGMEIYTVVKAIDRERDRIFVSMRELLGTWQENAAMFSAGQTVAGVIRSVESYGIFVELTPNLAGLAELRDDLAFLNREDAVGRLVAVYIKSIIPERMKIKLVLVDSYKGEIVTPKLQYFTDCEKTLHIDSWRYSPPQSSKVVETVFC